MVGWSQELSVQTSVQKRIAYQPYEFQWGKCWILHWNVGNLDAHTTWGTRGWRESSQKPIWGSWSTASRIRVSDVPLQLKGPNSILRCISHSTTSQLREGIVLLCSALLQSRLEYCVQFGALQYKKYFQPLKESKGGLQRW